MSFAIFGKKTTDYTKLDDADTAPAKQEKAKTNAAKKEKPLTEAQKAIIDLRETRKDLLFKIDMAKLQGLKDDSDYIVKCNQLIAKIDKSIKA